MLPTRSRSRFQPHPFAGYGGGCILSQGAKHTPHKCNLRCSPAAALRAERRQGGEAAGGRECGLHRTSSLTADGPLTFNMHLRAFLRTAAPRSRGLLKVIQVTTTGQSLRAALPPETMHHKLLGKPRATPAPGGAPIGRGRLLFRYM